MNANNVKTDGIDLDIVWRQSLKEWGNLTTEFQWTHIFSYSQTSGRHDVQVRRHAGQLRRASAARARPRTA